MEFWKELSHRWERLKCNWIISAFWGRSKNAIKCVGGLGNGLSHRWEVSRHPGAAWSHRPVAGTRGRPGGWKWRRLAARRTPEATWTRDSWWKPIGHSAARCSTRRKMSSVRDRGCRRSSSGCSRNRTSCGLVYLLPTCHAETILHSGERPSE